MAASMNVHEPSPCLIPNTFTNAIFNPLNPSAIASRYYLLFGDFDFVHDSPRGPNSTAECGTA